MVREIEYMPILNFRSAIKGFIAGSMFALSVFNDWTLAGQAGVFILGFLILLDTFIPYGRQPYIVSSVVAAIIGIILGLVFSFWQLGSSYLVFIFIIGALVYIDRLVQRLRR